MEIISKLFTSLQNKIKQFIYFNMEIIGLALALGGGFALGMYVTTQIGDWINKR